MSHILDTENIVDDVTDRKIFLGNYSGFMRYDLYKYPFAKNIEEKMRQNFWTPSEISLVSDRIKFPDLPFEAQEAITMNLLFQTLLDSIQSRGLDTVLAEITTSPEFEGVFRTQGYFEFIHSLAYSHILREVFPDSTSVFDRIGEIPEIKERAKKEIDLYNFFTTEDYKNMDETDKKKTILEMIVRIYALEALKFYMSFLVTYIINVGYNNSIQGISKIIKLIHADENIHVSVMAGLLGILKKNKDEGFSELMQSDWYKKMVVDIIKSVVEDEIEWGGFLLSFGNIPSLTPTVIEKFMKYYGNERLKLIGFDPVYKVDRIDIVDWFENYHDIDLDNVAGQESEALAYKIGILKNDIPEGKM